MKSFLTVTCFAIIISQWSPSTFGCQTPSTTSTTPKKDWWQTAQFYQIYPRSFKDSNGDGIGDLKGITSKLDYLKEIGVTATWLSPIYKSPMADFGYDIADFFDIQDEYGNLDDFAELVKQANNKGLKVILDFVPNHSSDENVWFTKSVNRERGYEDFYVWHDGKKDANGNRIPPNNWLQAFRGSAWEWNEKRQQYYLHQFAVKQPDLNYRNPAVVAQMKRVLTYWLDRGVAGFRIDAVPWCFEVNADANGDYPDEPVSGFTDDPEESAYLKHIYTQDQPETVDMVYQWRKLLDDYQRIHGGDTRVLLIETYSGLDYVMQMYGNKTTEGAQIPFNFQFILDGNKDSVPARYAEIIKLWMDKMPAGKTPNWVMGNHDQRRVGSRYGKERIDIMNMIQMILPGVSITYMGEELGMLDGEITWEQSKDPAACNSNPQIYEKFTRDPARTPFQWDTSVAAGFSTNSNTWLPVNPNYVDINVQNERNTKSHLNVYKQMVELRKTDVLKFGTVQYGMVGNGVLVIKRTYQGKSYVLVANILGTPDTVNLSSNTQLNISGSLRVKIPSVDSSKQAGASVVTTQLSLGQYEAVVLES
ncbi:maltase A3-like [Episyrphus balteatus]|uniref:maltase A3-like n=1 Tax=Episyrphus balteatus TaxID=286459 RepID=UPI002485DC7B|nr:maltase A3-like [Episyrphus balteatus]